MPETISIAAQSSTANQPIFVEVSRDAKISDLLEVVRVRELSFPNGSEIAIFLQDEDDEIDVDISLEQAGVLKHPRIHIGRHKLRIEVLVHFNGQTQRHRFGPGRTINSVLHWAVCAFNLSGTEETEYAFQLCGSKDYLDPATHIGCLIQHSKPELCFDLCLENPVQG